MCVIVYKKKEKDFPSKEILQKCWTHNPDGAGFAFYKDDKVYYEKGFMEFDKFYEALEKYKSYEKKSSFVFHFRIGTQGGNVPSLTHPFPITNNLDSMLELSGSCDAVAFHNGILGLTSTADFKKKYPNHSDTSLFVGLLVSRFYNKGDIDKDFDDMMPELTAGNRVLFMDNFGIRMYGTWQEKYGYNFSNLNWDYTYLPSKNYSYGGWWNNEDSYGDDWGNGYPQCKDCYSSKCSSCVGGNLYMSYKDYRDKFKTTPSTDNTKIEDGDVVQVRSYDIMRSIYKEEYDTKNKFFYINNKDKFNEHDKAYCGLLFIAMKSSTKDDMFFLYRADKPLTEEGLETPLLELSSQSLLKLAKYDSYSKSYMSSITESYIKAGILKEDETEAEYDNQGEDYFDDYVCDDCGKPAKYIDTDTGECFCKKCALKALKKDKGRPIEKLY